MSAGMAPMPHGVAPLAMTQHTLTAPADARALLDDMEALGERLRAVRAAVGHGFSPTTDGGLGLRRVLLRTAGSNVASQRVALALGMTEVGRDRLAETLGDGTVEDMVRFDLLAQERDAR